MSLKTIGNILKIVLAACVFAGSMPPSSALAAEVIKIGGTGCGLGIMKKLGEAFEKKYRGTKVQVVPSLGSKGGIKAVAKDAVDIGISSRPLEDDEKRYGLAVIEFARTPFIIVTNKSDRVSNLSTEDLVKIYAGRINTWPDGRRIRPVLRPEGDIDTSLIRQMSPEMDKAVTAEMSREGMLTAITDQDATSTVMKTPGGLGFSTLGQVISEKLPLNIVRLNGVFPTTEALSNGSYKIDKPLLFLTRPAPPAKVRDFLHFVDSPAGMRILKESRYLVTRQKTGR